MASSTTEPVLVSLASTSSNAPRLPGALPGNLGALELQIPDLVLPVVAQRHNVVHLEPEMMRLMEAAAWTDAIPHRV